MLTPMSKRVVLLTGLAFVVLGLALGLAPRTASGVSCGSAFAPSDKAEVADATAAILADNGGGPYRDRDLAGRCQDTRTAMRFPAIALLVIGGLTTAGVTVKHLQDRDPTSGVEKA